MSLFREDASLLEAAGWLQELQFRRLENRQGAEEILGDVLALLNDGLLPDHSTVDRVDSDGLWVKRGSSVLELRDLSDGYRVALVIDIIRHMVGAFGSLRVVRTNGSPLYVDMPAVVLIDEADAHLHVSWQQRIGFWLSERFPEVQFLVTTHSPFTCQAATAGGLYTLAGPGERRGAQPVDEGTFKKVVNGTANDAVLSKLFGLDRARSERAEEMTREWSSLRANLARRALSAKEKERKRVLESQLPLPLTSAGGASLRTGRAQHAACIREKDPREIRDRHRGRLGMGAMTQLTTAAGRSIYTRILRLARPSLRRASCGRSHHAARWARAALRSRRPAPARRATHSRIAVTIPARRGAERVSRSRRGSPTRSEGRRARPPP